MIIFMHHFAPPPVYIGGYPQSPTHNVRRKPSTPTPSYLYGATVNRWQQSIFMEQRGLLCQQIGVEKSSQRASKYLKWKDKVENSQTNATMYLYGATRPTMSTIPRVEKSFHSFQTKHQHFQNIHKNKDKKSNIFKCPNIWGIVLPTSTILIIVNISTTTWESKLKA